MKIMRILTLLILCLGGLQALAQDNVWAQPGPYQTATRQSLTFTLPDGGEYPASVQYPLTEPGFDSRFPVIAFSHGLGGSKDIFHAVTRHWASHGYVVIQPSHNDEGVRFSNGGMHPSSSKVRERLSNITTLLNNLDYLEMSIPALDGRLDRNSLAVAGHSYGAFITLLAGGVSVDMGEQGNTRLAYPGLRCILPVSPSGRGDYGMHDDSFESLTLPMMMFTGTRDQRNGRPEDWRMEPFHLSPPGDKYLINITGARHGDFGGDSDNTVPVRYVNAASTAFWEACIRGSEEAARWLKATNGFPAFAADGAIIESR